VDCVVIVPTYNESHNVGPLLERIRLHHRNLNVLFVDDGSPDGTAHVIAGLMERDDRVALLERNGPRGYAAASQDGFRRALGESYSTVVTMDCDLSHDPLALFELLHAIDEGADLVIGSRYVPGGATRNWPLRRRLLSRWGNKYTALMLRLPVADCTSGFRAYRAECLRAILDARPTAEGYAFLTEMLRLASESGNWVIRERPITFADRTIGESKMNLSIVLESMRLVTTWGIRSRLKWLLRQP